MKREDFLHGIGSWDDHRLLLWEALELTKESKLPVAEFGAGDGSTPYLRKYCEDNNREFFSYENNKEWAEKCGSVFIKDWEDPQVYKNYSVLLVDCAPGEIRHELIAIFKDRCEIIVIHDTEIEASGYMLYKIWPLFSSRVDCINPMGKGAEASAVSNKIDLTSWVGISHKNFKIIK